MSHSVIFQSESLQERSDSRWELPLAYSQAELDAWYPRGVGIKDNVSHLFSIMNDEIRRGESLVVRISEWPEDLDKAESWAANVASHLARAYAIARALEKYGVGDVVIGAVAAQSKVNRLHDASEWRIAEIEAA